MEDFNNNNLNNNGFNNNNYNTGYNYNNNDNSFNNNMGINNPIIENNNDQVAFNNQNSMNNNSDMNSNNMNTNNMNNSNGSKKATKVLIIAIVLLLIVIIASGIVLFLHSKGAFTKTNQNTVNQIDTIDNEIDTTGNETSDSYAIVTELSKLPKSHAVTKKIEEYNSLKTATITGKFEALFNLNYEDIYKIAVDTNDMLFFNSSKEDEATFYMVFTDDATCPVSFELIYDEQQKFDELTSESEEKGTIYTYNDWKYYLTDEGVVIYYAFNRSEGDNAILCLTIEDETFNEMSEDTYKDVSQKLVDCVSMEHIGKYAIEKYEEADSKERACTNVLVPDDIGEITISDTIKLNLKTNFVIKAISNMAKMNSNEFITNTINADVRTGETRSGEYSIAIKEEKGKTVSQMRKTYEENDYKVEPCDLNGTEAFVSYNAEGVFGCLFFEIDGVGYEIRYTQGNSFYENTFDKNSLKYEAVLTTLGEILF